MTSYNRRRERKSKALRGRITTMGNPKGRNCHWCGRAMRALGDETGLGASRDHVLPESKGGKFKVWACKTCNNTKGDMTPDEWQQYMTRNPRWWKSE